MRIAKDSEWHQRQLGKARFAVDEDGHHGNAKDQEADDLGRVPRERDTSKVQADEQHKGDAEDTDAATPINGPDASDSGRTGVVDVEEQQQDDEGRAGNWQVDPENPAPRETLGQGTAENRASRAGNGPDNLKQT